MKVSILIPVYNEFRTLTQVVERVLAAPLPPGCTKEVVIVDDGSTDGTTQLLTRYSGSPLIVVHHSAVNQGKGAALRIGISKATGDVLLVQDGDLEYDPNDYAAVLAPIVRGDAEIVYGSRFLRPFEGMRRRNWIANKILTLASNLLFGAGITDEATAYKAFTQRVLASMELRCRRFEFCPEVTAKSLRLGYRIAEVPISYQPRGIADGKKIKWQDGVQALWTLAKYRFVPRSSFARKSTPAKVRSRSAGQSA